MKPGRRGGKAENFPETEARSFFLPIEEAAMVRTQHLHASTFPEFPVSRIQKWNYAPSIIYYWGSRNGLSSWPALTIPFSFLLERIFTLTLFISIFTACLSMISIFERPNRVNESSFRRYTKMYAIKRQRYSQNKKLRITVSAIWFSL